MVEKFKEFVNKLNQYGIPLPLFRDNKTGTGSISLTLMVVSFATCIIGLGGKASGFFGGIDLSQALTLFGVTSALYFGRSLNSKTGDVSAAVSTDQETK